MVIIMSLDILPNGVGDRSGMALALGTTDDDVAMCPSSRRHPRAHDIPSSLPFSKNFYHLIRLQ